MEGSFWKDNYGSNIDKGPERAREVLRAITKAYTRDPQTFWVYKTHNVSVIFSQAKRRT